MNGLKQIRDLANTRIIAICMFFVMIVKLPKILWGIFRRMLISYNVPMSDVVFISMCVAGLIYLVYFYP